MILLQKICDNIITIPAGEDCILDGGESTGSNFFRQPKCSSPWNHLGKTVGEELQVFVEDPNWKLRRQKSWLWGGWKETAPTKSQCFTHLFSSHLLGVVILLMEEILHQLIGSLYGWWFQICYIFIPTWGKWFNLTIAYFCKWVGTKTTNQLSAFFRQHLSNSMDPTITGLGANRKESLFCRGGLTSVPSVRVPSWERVEFHHPGGFWLPTNHSRQLEFFMVVSTGWFQIIT